MILLIPTISYFLFFCRTNQPAIWKPKLATKTEQNGNAQALTSVLLLPRAWVRGAESKKTKTTQKEPNGFGWSQWIDIISGITSAGILFLVD